MVLAASQSGCGPSTAQVGRAVTGYLTAVQTEDPDALFCASAGAAGSAARADFDAWATAEYDRYLVGRDEGFVDLSSSPIVLAKAFALGKGAFYMIRSVRSAGPEGAEVIMEVRFAYGDVDLSGLSPDTTFYLCGSPLGTIHSIRIPREPTMETRVALESAEVRWTLVREPEADGCEAGWKVNSAEVIPGTETTRRVSWIF